MRVLAFVELATCGECKATFRVFTRERRRRACPVCGSRARLLSRSATEDLTAVDRVT